MIETNRAQPICYLSGFAVKNYSSGSEERAPAVRAAFAEERGLFRLSEVSKHSIWEIADSGVAVTSNVNADPTPLAQRPYRREANQNLQIGDVQCHTLALN